MTLKTITPEHRDLRQIVIYLSRDLTLFEVGADLKQFLGGAISRQWSDLDRLLVEFWESRSIRPRVGRVTQGERRRSMEYCIGCLLPEIKKRGIVDMV